jgi:uncharacterized protein
MNVLPAGFGMALRLLAAVMVLTASACATAPPERLYKLSPGVRSAARPDREHSRSVVVAQAVLPEVVDRPQLVLRADENRVTILEQQRWAEPLRSGVSRVIAEDLAELLGIWRVSSRDDVVESPDCRVRLDFRHFEIARGGTAVRVEALWTVACAGSVETMGRSAVEEKITGPVTGSSFDAVVAAHGRALDSVSRDIAVALGGI